jgi:hypothetical protein
MRIMTEAALAGRRRSDKALAELLDVDAERVEALGAGPWAIFRQGAAALLSEDIWRDQTADRVLACIGDLIADQGESYGEPLRCYAASDCIPVRLPGYEEPAYFAGFARTNPIAARELSRAAEILHSLPDWEWIHNFIGSVVITGPPGEQHVSSSQQNVPGTIFTQSFHTIEHAAETVIHESAHTTFNLAIAGIGVLDDVLRDTALYYSPCVPASAARTTTES